VRVLSMWVRHHGAPGTFLFCLASFFFLFFFTVAVVFCVRWVGEGWCVLRLLCCSYIFTC
jgi:hypothetical protein